MKLALPYSVLLFVILAMAPAGAGAEEKPSTDSCEIVSQTTCEIALDIDRDGRPDRATLIRHPTGASADLSIDLAAGGETNVSGRPAILKKDIADGQVMRLVSKGRGSLVIQYGCGGCSNDFETALTIVHRDGEFWVAGFRREWETRDHGAGSCDINFLTGRGVRSQEQGKARPIEGKFSPVRLADWSAEKRPKACL